MRQGESGVSARAGPDLPLSLPGAARYGKQLEASRRELLAAIGDGADLTFIRGVGNLGDELIYAGTRQLLRGRAYREISLDEVAGAGGETALLAGGGAWCRTYHELMPQMLAVAELRFARVIVLPSTFDAEVEDVHDALARTRALVFARERESYRQICQLCAARLAHDCAFFYDFTPYLAAGPGTGVLNAFRSDSEAYGRWAPPPDNVDISTRCESLAQWLQTIARHAIVRTDRAHVMIAAALLGKQVEYLPSSYHKVPAIARYALADFPVRRLDEATVPPRELEPAALQPGLEELRRRLRARAERQLAMLPEELLAAGGAPRVTLVVLTWNRIECVRRLVQSIRESARIPCKLLVLDNNSPPAMRAELGLLAGESGDFTLHFLPRNLGCPAARQLAVGQVETEYLVFLDDDFEVFPGTIEHLVAALDRHPEALAVGGQVVLPDGHTQFCGGDLWELPDGVLHFEPLGRGLPFDDPGLGDSRVCQWLGGAMAAYRTAALRAYPIDRGMAHYYEDNEWFYRVGRLHGGVFRRSVLACGLHHQEPKERRDTSLAELIRALPYIESIARFYQVHGKILEGIFAFVPELTGGGGRDVAAARLLLELYGSQGRDWLLTSWLNGSLAPLFTSDLRHQLALRTRQLEESRRQVEAARAELDRARRQLAAIHGSRWWRLANFYWTTVRRFRRRAAR